MESKIDILNELAAVVFVLIFKGISSISNNPFINSKYWAHESLSCTFDPDTPHIAVTREILEMVQSSISLNYRWEKLQSLTEDQRAICRRSTARNLNFWFPEQCLPSPWFYLSLVLDPMILFLFLSFLFGKEAVTVPFRTQGACTIP